MRFELSKKDIPIHVFFLLWHFIFLQVVYNHADQVTISFFLSLPPQADLNTNAQDDPGAFYGVTSQ